MLMRGGGEKSRSSGKNGKMLQGVLRRGIGKQSAQPTRTHQGGGGEAAEGRFKTLNTASRGGHFWAEGTAGRGADEEHGMIRNEKGGKDGPR